MYLAGLLEDPFGWAVGTAVVIFSICCHEWAHARTALALGDDTAARAGHLTLNPLRQMGWMSLTMLALCGLAWGAVPVDEARMRGKWAPEIVALAGPAMNVALWIGFLLVSRLAISLGNSLWVNVAFQGAVVNFALALLNLVPIQGLDGHRFFRRILPPISGNVSLLLVILLFFFGAKYLFTFAYAVSEITLHILP